MKLFKNIILDNIELIFFLAALAFLFINLSFTKGYSFCILHNLGFEYCPGCGIGASIHEAMHFNFAQSFDLHPLGIFAFIIISLRIIMLFTSLIREIKYGQNFTNDARNRTR